MDNGMGNALEGQSIQLAWGIEMAVQNPPAPPVKWILHFECVLVQLLKA